MSADDANLIIGNLWTGNNNCFNPLYQVLIFDVVLTSAQMSQLYNEFMQSASIGVLGKRNFEYPNIIANGEFSTDTVWTKGTGWTIANGMATSDGSQIAISALTQDCILEPLQEYTATIDVQSVTSGGLYLFVGGASSSHITTAGRHVQVLTSGASPTYFNIRADVNFIGSVQKVRLEKGNKCMYRNTFEDSTVSLGATSEELNGWRVVSGTWKISDGLTFNALSQTSRAWRAMTTGLNGDVYACVYGGDIYKQTGGVGDFIALSQTSRNWIGMTTGLNGDVYACVNGGDIYKQTGGVGDFNALSQTSRAWREMTTGLNGDVYACVNAEDIYKQTGGVGDFVALSQTSRNWTGMTTGLNGDVYANIYGGDIYKQTGGVGDFVALSQTSRNWYGMTTGLNGDVYACVDGGDIYKQTGGIGNFIALSQTTRNWTGMNTCLNGDVYASNYGGDIYKYSLSDEDTYSKQRLECVTDGQVKTPLSGASGYTTDTFLETGSATLTKNANDLQIDAVAGDKIFSVILTA